MRIILSILISTVFITQGFSNVDSLDYRKLKLNIEELNEHTIKHLKEDVNRLQHDLKKAEETIEKHDDLYQKWVYFLSFIAVLGYGGWVWIKDKAKERVEEVIKDESSTLSQLFSDVKTDRDIRLKTKILILTQDGLEDSNLKNLLKSNKFYDLTFKKFDLGLNLEEYNCNMVIFTDIFDSKSEKELLRNYAKNDIKILVQKSPQSIKYFYFGSEFLDEDLAKSYTYRISSSKFPSQVIGNIMNLLKYN